MGWGVLTYVKLLVLLIVGILSTVFLLRYYLSVLADPSLRMDDPELVEQMNNDKVYILGDLLRHPLHVPAAALLNQLSICCVPRNELHINIKEVVDTVVGPA